LGFDSFLLDLRENNNKMLTTIEGVYENGHVIFNENPPTITKSKVLVTFIGDFK
jgi:hypothetical protein